MDISFLEELGFTKSEIDVYVALLELGSTTTGALVDKSGTSSSKIYEILDRLIKKGMANYVLKGNIKHFSAAQPKRLLDYIEEQEKKLEQQKKRAEILLPELELKAQLAQATQEAKIYRGMQGLKAAFNEGLAHMQKGEIYYAYGIPQRTGATNTFFAKWNAKREQQHIIGNILFNNDAHESAKAQGLTGKYTHVRFTPPGIEMPASINIFNDFVVIFPSETQQEPLLIAIQDARVAESFKAQFEVFWNQTTRTYTGVEGPRIVLEETIASGAAEKMMALDGNAYLTYMPNIVKTFVKTMQENKQEMQLIFSEDANPTPIVAKHTSVRYLPREYISPSHIQIYGDHVALIDWTEPITTVIIDKPEMAKRYHDYFEKMWSIARPANPDEVQQLH